MAPTARKISPADRGKYDPASIESSWYTYWEENGLFQVGRFVG